MVIGAKGMDDPERFPLGSVAQKVMKYADCSVLLAREKTAMFRRVLLAVDGSQDSDAVATFLLELPLPRFGEVILLTCLQSHIAALPKIPFLDFKSNPRILTELQANEERGSQAFEQDKKTIPRQEIRSFIVNSEGRACRADTGICRYDLS